MVVTDTCTCQSIGADPKEVRLCVEHHIYLKGDKRLTSVSRILKSMWPFKPDFSKADPAVIENARDRGVEVDTLFSAYVNGTLEAIPAGTREDAFELFCRVRRWWDSRKHKEQRSQVILADDEIAGTCDVLADDWIYDLKTTYNIEPTYPLQLAAYAELHFATFGRPVKGLTIVHLTKRFPEPKIINVDMSTALPDWMTMRQMWALVKRRTKKDATEQE